ncbi:MAG: hypothetical protein MJZ95_02145 [Paludibacteraceae bacterium]|nr:hypothetical protein [Paludibacteraceae bacterium]
MKKVFFAVAVVAAMGLSMISCDKNKVQCHKVTYMEKNLQMTVYMWDTRNNIDAVITEWEKMFGRTNIKVSYATKYKTAQDCIAAN